MRSRATSKGARNLIFSAARGDWIVAEKTIPLLEKKSLQRGGSRSIFLQKWRKKTHNPEKKTKTHLG